MPNTPTNNTEILLNYPSPLNTIAEINTSQLWNITYIVNGNSLELWNRSLLWLEFNNNSVSGESDSDIRDLSPYNRTINISGPDVINNCGKFGGCRQSDGITDYMTVDGLNLDNVQNYTIMTSFYFVPETTGVAFDVQGAVFSQHSSNCRSGNALGIQNQSDGTYVLKYYISNSTTCISVSGNSNIAEGWNDIAVTKNGTYYIIYINSERRFWQNSTSDTSNDATFTLMSYSSSPTTANNYSLKGNISKFIVFDFVMTDDQIRETHSLTQKTNGWIVNSTKIIRNTNTYSIEYGSNGFFTGQNTYNITSMSLQNATINYALNPHTIRFSLGLQSDQDDLTDTGVFPTVIGQLFDNVTSNTATERGSNRIWIKEDGYGSDDLHNMPLNAPTCDTYNYTNLSMQIGWTLENNMYPLLTFAQVPSCWANFTQSTCSAKFPNASYYDEFYNYTGEVAEHYYNECSDGILDYTNISGSSKTVSCGNFSKWYWEIWNEPFCSSGYSLSEYTNQLYIPIQSELKNRSQNISVSSAGQINSASCSSNGNGVDKQKEHNNKCIVKPYD